MIEETWLVLEIGGALGCDWWFYRRESLSEESEEDWGERGQPLSCVRERRETKQNEGEERNQNMCEQAGETCFFLHRAYIYCVCVQVT